jgi:branched-chain amino acid transport system substrate-binding protein
MNKRAFIKAAVVAAAALSYSFAWAADPIRIGTVLSVTGPAAFLGDPQLKTLQLYVEKVNEEGGVLGRKLELVHYDDAGEAAKANGFAKRLIENDKVDIILGGSTTGSTMAMAGLVEKAEIPFISLAGAVVIVEPTKKWMFKTPHTDRMAAEKVLDDMKKRGLSKIGLLSETSGFGQSGRKETQVVAAKYGISLVADETYGAKDTDVTTQLTKIKNAPGVQALFVFGFGQGPAIVAKNYAQLGMTLPRYESHGVASDEYKRLSGTAAEGVRLPSPALLIVDQLSATDPQQKVAANYAKTYALRWKENPSTFGGYAYDALLIALDSFKRAGSTDKAKVRDAIEQTKELVGTSGIFTMSPSDHMGLDLSAFRLLEIKGGSWVVVK